MKSNFLPKAINRTDSNALCIDIQSGPLITDIHWHDCAEIIHLQSGCANLFTADDWTVLREGETALIPIGEAHCCHSPDKNSRRIVIGLTEELIGGLGARREAMLALFRQGTVKKRIFKSTPALSSLFSLLRDGDCTTVSTELKKQLYVALIYSELLFALEKEGISFSTRQRSPAVKEIEGYILAHYTEQISAEECARAVKLSYSHMALLLRKECGAGFGELLLARRLEEAKKLLLTTQLSITEIGAEVGFTDTSYFIKRFGERLGTTPLKYRESNLSVIS